MLDPNMDNEPELLLPSNIPEDMFDVLFVESHALLNAMNKDVSTSLIVDDLTNNVSDILRIYNIYDLYKDNLAGLVVMYASWIILESLRRSQEIDTDPVDFEKLFDNDTLMIAIEKHQIFFEKTIKTIIVT